MKIPGGLLIFLLAASNSHAASLYKCSGPKKDTVSIQSAPCPPGARQIWVRDGTPDPPPTEQQVAAKNAKGRQDAEAARTLSRMAGTTQTNHATVYQNSSNADLRIQRCNSAKRQAEAIRERDWRKMNFNELRRLDAWVESECKKT